MRSLFLLCALLLTAPAALAAKTILIMGDSLSAGYGIQPNQAWPALLAQRLQAQRLDYNVANLSISGETTAGGRSRLAKALTEQRPALLILALGANDGLRGLPLNQMRDNLQAMITAGQAAGAKVMLVGMRLPPNYGPYADAFAETFQKLAQADKLPWQAFLLEPIISRPELFQADQLHPRAEAQPLLLDHLWPTLRPLLK
ncbi:MAG: arylesterase [Rhodocyclales bacterium]|nr:arylesterase [Rhodocyclales bacterium]